MTRRALLAVVLASSSLGFAHAALTTEVPPAAVQCYEDGSCDDGRCEPFAACDDRTDLRGGRTR